MAAILNLVNVPRFLDSGCCSFSSQFTKISSWGSSVVDYFECTDIYMLSDLFTPYATVFVFDYSRSASTSGIVSSSFILYSKLFGLSVRFTEVLVYFYSTWESLTFVIFTTVNLPRSGSVRTAIPIKPTTTPM